MRVPVTSVDADIEAAERALRPGGREVAGPALSFLRRNVSWRIPDMNADAVALYLDAIGDIPPDLLRLGAKRAVRDLRWWPSPADFRGCISAELSARRHALSRLRHADWKLRKQRDAEAPKSLESPKVVPMPRMRRLTEVPKTAEETTVEVTPEQAAAWVEQWGKEIG